MPNPVQEQMFLLTALTVEVPTDAIDFTLYEPGVEVNAEFDHVPIIIEVCPACGRPGRPGRRRKDKTMIHRATLIKGVLNIDQYCTLKEPTP